MKTAVITGASRGIGLEFVTQYLNEGWKVIAGCRSPESVPALQALQQTHDKNLTIAPLELCSNESRQAFAKAIGDSPINLLINNAGFYGPTTKLGDISDEAWLEVFHINAIAPLKLVDLLLSNLMSAEVAKVVFLSSKMGSIEDNTSGGSYPYRASKAALNAAMKSLAIELEEFNVWVASLHPGWVKTAMGGPNALIDTTASVSGMRRIIEHLDQQKTGSFIAFDGTLIPW